MLVVRGRGMIFKYLIVIGLLGLLVWIAVDPPKLRR